jgi:hypothetical protein
MNPGAKMVLFYCGTEIRGVVNFSRTVATRHAPQGIHLLRFRDLDRKKLYRLITIEFAGQRRGASLLDYDVVRDLGVLFPAVSRTHFIASNPRQRNAYGTHSR